MQLKPHCNLHISRLSTLDKQRRIAAKVINHYRYELLKVFRDEFGKSPRPQERRRK